MKICLIIPPAQHKNKVPERVYGCTFSYYRQPELPMMYVGAVLEEDQHDVLLKDFSVDNSWDDFCQFISNSHFDVYIFHTVLLAESIDLKSARFILGNSEANIIFFGPHPTLKPQQFLLDERCYVARGEAEFIIRYLIRALALQDKRDLQGIAYLKGTKMVEQESYGIIENIDTLPLPARHLLKDKNEFFNPKFRERPITLMLTSRGCSFRCSYCVPNSISWARELEWKRFHNGQKPPVSLRSPASIIKEFAYVKEQGYKAVYIIDDMFFWGGKKRILEICNGLREVNLPFAALARCDLILDEEIVSGLSKAQCRCIDLGIESLDQNILNDVKKDLEVVKIKESIELLNKYSIEPKANILIAASPLETKKTLSKTIREITKYPINYCMFLIATPFPGTDFFHKALKEGWAIEPEIHDLENNLSPTEKSLVAYHNLSKKDIERAIKKANRYFYMHPKRIWFQLKQIRSLKAFKDLVTTGWKVIK